MAKRAILIIAVLLAFVANQSFAEGKPRICGYEDYDYIPHPDWEIGGNKPRTFRMRSENNPNFVSYQGGIREYFILDTIDPTTDEMKSTVRMPFGCIANGIMNCYLDVKGNSQPADYLDIAVFKNFASGSMTERVPYAIAIPGLMARTRNGQNFSEENVIKSSEDYLFMPYFVPEEWVSDKQISNNCVSPQSR